MTAHDVSWHEENLKNHKIYLQSMKNRLADIIKRETEEIAKNEIAIAWSEYQIRKAKEQNKTSFDEDRFLAKEKPGFWIPVYDALLQREKFVTILYDEKLKVKISKKEV